MSQLTYGSLFSGIGGCEMNKRKIAAYKIIERARKSYGLWVPISKSDWHDVIVTIMAYLVLYPTNNPDGITDEEYIDVIFAHLKTRILWFINKSIETEKVNDP